MIYVVMGEHQRHMRRNTDRNTVRTLSWELEG